MSDSILGKLSRAQLEMVKKGQAVCEACGNRKARCVGFDPEDDHDYSVIFECEKCCAHTQPCLRVEEIIPLQEREALRRRCPYPPMSLQGECWIYDQQHPNTRSKVMRSCTRPEPGETFDVGFILGCEINYGMDRKEAENHWQVLSVMPEGYEYFGMRLKSDLQDVEQLAHDDIVVLNVPSRLGPDYAPTARKRYPATASQ